MTQSAGQLISTESATGGAASQQQNVSDEIPSLIRSFRSLINTVEKSMIDRSISAEDVVNEIKNIPTILNLKLGDCLWDRAPKIFEAKSIKLLFLALSVLWDYLNPGLAEFIVKEFGSKPDKKITEAYKKHLEEFRKRVTLVEYINADHAEKSNPNRSIYTEMITKFGSEWESKTLQDAEEYKTKVCTECHFLSPFLTRISIRRSSIAIVFYFPCLIEAEGNRLEALFLEKKAEQVSVNDMCVFDKTGQVCIVQRIKGGREGEWRDPERKIEGGDVAGCMGLEAGKGIEVTGTWVWVGAR